MRTATLAVGPVKSTYRWSVGALVCCGLLVAGRGAVVRGQESAPFWPAGQAVTWPVNTGAVQPVAFQSTDGTGGGEIPLPSQTTNLPPAALPLNEPQFNPPVGAGGAEAGTLPAPSVPSTVPTPPPANESWLSPWGVPAPFVLSEWDGSFEIGINGTEGNAESMSFRTGGNLKRKVDQWEFTTDIIYAKTLANGVETQHNAIYNAGYEWFFGPTSPWSHFGKLNLEYDEFKAFDLRLVLNAGLGYQFWKSDITSLKGRFGAGTSHEINGPDDRWVPEAVFGADYTHQWSKRQKLNLTTDYFPEWDDFHNYRLVTSLGWEYLLDDTSNLSLKLSVNDRYDSTPNGRKPNDVIYSLLLLWKI